MGVGFMTEQERQQLRQLWAQQVEAFLDSGMSQRAWCEQHGLRPNQLGYWLRKVRSEQIAGNSPRWISLEAVPATSSGVALRIGNVALELQRGFDQEVLARLSAC